VTSEDDIERLCKGSGETVDKRLSFTRGSRDETQTIQEVVVPRLCRNALKLASDDELQSIFLLTRGSGYAQFGGLPFIARSDYHISPDEYGRRKGMPLGAAPGTFVATREPGDEPPSDQSPASKPHSPGGPTISTETVTWEATSAGSGPPADPLESYFSERGE
jgi:hypothetical protein